MSGFHRLAVYHGRWTLEAMAMPWGCPVVAPKKAVRPQSAAKSAISVAAAPSHVSGGVEVSSITTSCRFPAEESFAMALTCE